MSDKLSTADIERLLEDPSIDTRTETARKIAGGYGEGTLSSDERTIAEDIFRVMVRDAEVRVREALAVNLKTCEFLPHEVAKSLAEDVDQVSLPMLQYSSVLTEEDLIEIVSRADEVKHLAVASRAHVSQGVSAAIIEHGNTQAVTTLVGNGGAEISEESLDRALKDHGTNAQLGERMALRAKLPVGIAERLVSIVSEKIRDHLMQQHDLPNEVVSDLIIQSRERATLTLISEDSGGNEVRALVSQLYRAGRLTPTIILRAVCMGDLRFFEVALSLLAKIPLVSARLLVHEKGVDGLRTVLSKAKIPTPLHVAFRAAVEVSRETDYDGLDNDRERFRRRMIERILTLFEDPGLQMGEENIDYLLGKLAQIDPSLSTAA